MINKSFSFEELSSNWANQLKAVSTKTWLAIISVFVIGVLNFGQIATSLAFNNDGVDRFQNNFFNFYNYTEIGRWSYPFVYHLFHFDTPIPFISVFISISLLTIVIIQIWSILNIHDFFTRILTGGFFLSFPILIHYFFYVGDIEVYSFGMLLVTSSMLIFKKNEGKFVPTVWVLNIIALGCYPALFSFINTLFLLIAIQFYLNQKNLKDALLVLFRGLVISATSLIIYYAITQLLLVIFDLQLTDYRNANETSMTDLLLAIPSKFIMIYDYFGLFFAQFTPVLRVLMILLFVGLIFIIPRKNDSLSHKIIFSIVVTGLLIQVIYSTYYITPESYLYVGFIYGYLPTLMLIISMLIKKANGYSKLLLIVCLSYFILEGIKSNNALAFLHQRNNQAAFSMGNNLMLEIQKTPGFKMKNTPVVFLGLINRNENYAFFFPNINTPVLNGMRTPVGFPHENRPTRIQSIMRQLNHSIQVAELPEEIYDNKKESFKHLPVFPEEGCIEINSDTLYVRMGNY